MKSPEFVGFVFTSIVSCSIVFGQSAPPSEKSDTPSENKQDTSQAKKTSDSATPFPIKPIVEPDETQRPPSPDPRRDATVDRRLASFVRLRESMFETIKLDSAKRKKIDVMFDDYMAGLLDPNQMPHVQPRPEDAATPQELPDLRKQLEVAQKAADAEKIDLIKARIYYATIALEPSVIDDPVFFLAYVDKELDKEQRKEFASIVNRWRMLRVAEIAPDNDFKQLRRSTRDPLLVESEGVRKELDDIVIEAMRTVPLGPKRTDKEVMKELAAATKPKVLEKLDPKQREHFEKTLDMLKRWDKEDVEIARKTRERLKDHKITHGQ